MSDTILLRALRDACETYYHQAHGVDLHARKVAAITLAVICDRAIASLESAPAAEQPKPCAGFVCDFSDMDGKGVEPNGDGLCRGGRYMGNAPGQTFDRRWSCRKGDHVCRACGHPFSAHQQPPADEGLPLGSLGFDGKLWADEFRRVATTLGYSAMDEGWVLGWFCNAIMAGYDAATRKFEQPPAEQAQQPCRRCGAPLAINGHCSLGAQGCQGGWGECPTAQQPARKLVHGPEHGCAQPAPADVPPMPDADDDDWWGTASADDIRAIVFAREAAIAAERDEARRELAAERALHADVILRYGPFDKDIESLAKRLYVESSKLRARADKAEAELAALRAQEPQTPMQLAAAAVRAVCGLGPNADAEAETVRELAMQLKNYAKTHIPLAQHEAEVAQARRDERERVAAEWDKRGWHADAERIRALPDAGGEVGK